MAYGSSGSGSKSGSDDADLDKFSKDWQRLRAQKYRRGSGGVEARMITNLAMRHAEQYVQQAKDSIVTRPLVKDEDRNKLHLVFNLLGKARNQKIGRLDSIANIFRASPNLTDPRALDKAAVVTKLIKGLNFRLNEHILNWQRLSWIVDCGVCIEHTTWYEEETQEPMPVFSETGELLWRDASNRDPEAVMPQSMVEQMVMQGAVPERFTVVEQSQLVGDVCSEVISPLNFFIDAAVPTIAKLGHDQACYIAQVKTVDWIRNIFGSDVADQIQSDEGSDVSIIKSKLSNLGPTTAMMPLRDMLPAVAGSRSGDDPAFAIVLTRYQPASNEYPHGRRTILVPDQVVCDDGDCPYPEIPCIDLHFEAPTTTFWTRDFLTDLVAPNKFLNKRLSQLGEFANSAAYEVLLLGPMLDQKDFKSDMASVIKDGLSETGEPQVRPMERGQMPPVFVESIKLVIELMQQLSSSNLMDHPQYSQMRGSLSLPMMQEMLDSESGPLYKHLADCLSRIHLQRIQRVKQYYPPMRTLHMVGKGRKDETLVFHTDEVLRAGIEYQIVVDPGSLLPEMAALREARVMERLNSPLGILYTSKRTGKLDASLIAKDLKYADDETQDRESQYRDLAQHFIGRLWEGEPADAIAPLILPFFDHNSMLDEMEAAMATTEYAEASTPVRQAFENVWERHRNFLAQIQESQMQAVQSQMMNGAVAQATQQAAAKAASLATDAAIQQIHAQAQTAQANPPVQQLAAAAAQVHAQQAPPQPGPPQ